MYQCVPLRRNVDEAGVLRVFGPFQENVANGRICGAESAFGDYQRVFVEMSRTQNVDGRLNFVASQIVRRSFVRIAVLAFGQEFCVRFASFEPQSANMC